MPEIYATSPRFSFQESILFSAFVTKTPNLLLLSLQNPPIFRTPEKCFWCSEIPEENRFYHDHGFSESPKQRQERLLLLFYPLQLHHHSLSDRLLRLLFSLRDFSGPDREFLCPWSPFRCHAVQDRLQQFLAGVDLRSSNVCELGLLNYNAKHVFYPLERTRFRCRHDYYWASVFEVEYKEDYLGQTLHAMAEAPKEALPLDCRPGFGTAWLTKHKFKVNETYNCRYTPGISEVEIYPDSLFNCKAKDPSMLEMMRRFFILFLKSMNSFFSNTSDTLRAKSMLQGAVAGVVSGVLVASVFVVLLKLLMDLKLRLARKWGARSLRITVYAARFRRACIIVAYFSAMGWLAVQYGKMVGFSDLFISPHLGKKTAKRLLGHLSALLDFFLPFQPIVGHQFML